MVGILKLLLCLNESSLTMMKNIFYFILKALFTFKKFNLFFFFFGHAEKIA